MTVRGFLKRGGVGGRLRWCRACSSFPAGRPNLGRCCAGTRCGVKLGRGRSRSPRRKRPRSNGVRRNGNESVYLVLCRYGATGDSAAYLQARQPRSLRAAGVAFKGNHLRTAKIAIPPAFQREEGIWLSVEGRNGEVHHAAVEVARLSPALTCFIAGEDVAQETGEDWDATLSCWNEAEAVVCEGAAFGSGETRFMDDTAIEVSSGDGEGLLSARLNRKSQVRSPAPKGRFTSRWKKGRDGRWRSMGGMWRRRGRGADEDLRARKPLLQATASSKGNLQKPLF